MEYSKKKLELSTAFWKILGSSKTSVNILENIENFEFWNILLHTKNHWKFLKHLENFRSFYSNSDKYLENSRCGKVKHFGTF